MERDYWKGFLTGALSVGMGIAMAGILKKIDKETLKLILLTSLIATGSTALSIKIATA